MNKQHHFSDKIFVEGETIEDPGYWVHTGLPKYKLDFIPGSSINMRGRRVQTKEVVPHMKFVEGNHIDEPGTWVPA